MKENAKFFAGQICHQFNEAICSSKFPATLKFANVTPVFKQGTRNLKDNYKPISVLPIISKIFEKLICRQLSNHFNNIFPKLKCRFRKGFNAQHCIFLMIDKWKKAIHNNKVFGSLLTDLSKAFDCVCHDLPITKLHAYELSLNTLGLPSESKTTNQNRIFLQYMGEHYIWCSTRLYFRPLLFDIFLCDLFLEHEDCCFTSYAYDTTPYVVANNTAEVIENFTIITQKLFTWFANN